MLKFLGWVFGITRRHWRGIRNYESGLGGRIWTMILMLFSVAACIGSLVLFVKYVSEWMFEAKMPVMTLLFVIGFVITVFATAFDYCVSYCYVAFRNAFFGIIMTVALLAERDKKGKYVSKDGGVSLEEEPSSGVKTYKALDIIIGILGLICAIGVIASVFLVFAYYIKNK